MFRGSWRRMGEEGVFILPQDSSICSSAFLEKHSYFVPDSPSLGVDISHAKLWHFHTCVQCTSSMFTPSPSLPPAPPVVCSPTRQSVLVLLLSLYLLLNLDFMYGREHTMSVFLNLACFA